MLRSKMTSLGLYLNGALGSGKYDDITACEVKEQIRNHTIFDYLQSRLNTDIDLGFLTPRDKNMLNLEWQYMVNHVDEVRHLHVDENGLCLLVAYLFAGIRARVGSPMLPNDELPDLFAG